MLQFNNDFLFVLLTLLIWRDVNVKKQSRDIETWIV